MGENKGSFAAIIGLTANPKTRLRPWLDSTCTLHNSTLFVSRLVIKETVSVQLGNWAPNNTVVVFATQNP